MSISNNKTQTAGQALERPERLTLRKSRELIYDKFRTNLRVLCGTLQVSMVDASKEIGLKSGTRITDLQYGRGTPEMEEMILISKYFSVSIDDLISKQATITFK